VVGVECLELLVNSFFKGTFRNPDLDGFCPLIVRLGLNGFEGQLGTRNAWEVARTNNGSEHDLRGKCSSLLFPAQTENTLLG
jgi:hypothetical protein